MNLSRFAHHHRRRFVSIRKFADLRDRFAARDGRFFLAQQSQSDGGGVLVASQQQAVDHFPNVLASVRELQGVSQMLRTLGGDAGNLTELFREIGDPFAGRIRQSVAVRLKQFRFGIRDDQEFVAAERLPAEPEVSEVRIVGRVQRFNRLLERQSARDRPRGGGRQQRQNQQRSSPANQRIDNPCQP